MLGVAAVVVGVAILAYGSDQFVVGAARVASLRGVPPLVVGVVIIGFGTSSPELIVSVLAALRGELAVAVGNVVGSNLANLGLILGIGVLILPLGVSSQTVRREAPLAVLAMASFAVLVQGGLATAEGGALVVGMVAAIAIVVRRRPTDPLAAETEGFVAAVDHQMGREVLRTLLGLVATLGSAQLLLWGALDLAERAGLSEGLVGASVVAVGTSLPELVTVVQSARRGEGDLVLGNLLGSNLFNVLMVGGAVGLAGSTTLDAPRLTGFGAVAMVVQGLLVWLMMRTGRRLTRGEGVVLVTSYLALMPFLAG